MFASVAQAAVLAQGWGDGRHMAGWAIGGWGWLMMGLTMVVFWAAVIGLAVWLVRSSARDRQPDGRAEHTDRARRILSERLARGEIDTEEYERRLEVLE